MKINNNDAMDKTSERFYFRMNESEWIKMHQLKWMNENKYAKMNELTNWINVTE